MKYILKEYYLHDILGSVIAFTDVSKTIQTNYNYSSFGKKFTVGVASDNHYDFKGMSRSRTENRFKRFTGVAKKCEYKIKKSEARLLIRKRLPTLQLPPSLNIAHKAIRIR